MYLNGNTFALIFIAAEPYGAMSSRTKLVNDSVPTLGSECVPQMNGVKKSRAVQASALHGEILWITLL